MNETFMRTLLVHRQADILHAYDLHCASMLISMLCRVLIVYSAL